MTQLLILILIGLGAGVLSGMFGIGGGILIVPALVYFLNMSQHQAQGTSIGLMLLPIGILAAINYYKAGNLDIKAGLIIAGGFIIGGYFGSKVSLGLDQALLKKMFGVLLVFVAIKLIFFSK